jgi:hypothetical protein
MKHIHGYTRCHWTPPLGKYLLRIAPADAMALILAQKIKLWQNETTILKLALKKNETNPLLSSSNQQAA